jgi:hypothetical protein
MYWAGLSEGIYNSATFLLDNPLESEHLEHRRTGSITLRRILKTAVWVEGECNWLGDVFVIEVLNS